MISLEERLIRAYLNNEPMPLKGHTKITLTDVHTGEVEVHEEDNMVTNAVADVLAKNYCGLAQFYKLMPLKSLYAGVICFENTLTENASNYNPPADNVNKMVAHAGDEPNITAEVNSSRGSPNTGETTTTDTSIKFVWDFSTNQGNGTINSVCLCPDTLGNMGLRPYDNEFSPFTELGRAPTGAGSTTWIEAVSKQFPYSISSDGKTAKTVYLYGATFKEYTIRHDYTAFGIIRGITDWQEVSNRSATVRQAPNDANRRFIFDDDTYYYIACATSATAIQMDKVAKSDFTVTTADITLSGTSLYTGNFSASRNSSMRIYPFDGTNLYFPNSALTSFYKIPLANSANVSLLDGSITVPVGKAVGETAEFIPPITINNELIIGTNYIINGSKVYPQKEVVGVLEETSYNRTNENFLFLVRQGAGVYGNCTQAVSNNFKAYQGVVLCKMFLSTINNLENPVNKTSSQVMKIEYTLTEA